MLGNFTLVSIDDSISYVDKPNNWKNKASSLRNYCSTGLFQPTNQNPKHHQVIDRILVLIQPILPWSHQSTVDKLQFFLYKYQNTFIPLWFPIKLVNFKLVKYNFDNFLFAWSILSGMK